MEQTAGRGKLYVKTDANVHRLELTQHEGTRLYKDDKTDLAHWEQ